ncbi:peptidoglycan editing factor PgeF [Paenibacillus gansuensis]|uniref:Purine nucleoside phosphorylase n=1 Tax=Paenibacillus gansuensis TaxID=306542 RepID=A0ABW5PCZ8_9BACL
MEPFVHTAVNENMSLFYINSWMNAHPEVTAGFTSRSGGVSKQPYGSLNCALHVNDEDESVIRNRTLLAEALGLPAGSWTCGEQVHGNTVTIVEASDIGAGRLSRENAVQDTDALITNVTGVLLTSFYADCVPILFFDPVQKAAGLAHAGWKGTVQEIASNTVEAMHSAYGSRPEDILTAIGPSIGACCYEVDETVIAKVRSLQLEEPHYEDLGSGKYKVDLKGINRQILRKAGILPSHIEISKWCTGCRTDLFFSHRKENGMTGRMASWIAMTKEG